MTARVWGAVWMLAGIATTASAQSVTTETDITIGRSTDGTTAAAVQGRLFAASRSDWRVYFEGSWGLVRGGVSSDAFGAAYPYDRRVRAMEMFVEKTRTSDRVVLGLRAGRYRTPFGISGRSDHAYTGFLRAPLIRYGSNYALSNTFLETGASALLGTPRFTVETSVSVPTDEGVDPRRRGLSTVVRAQGYYRSLILGASHLDSAAQNPGPWATGRMVFHGIDGRWMRGGVQVRGEWIAGRSWDDVRTEAGYVDVIVHHERLGPVTLLGRVERLDYFAGEFSVYPRRLTAAARVRVTPSISVQAGVIRDAPLAPGNWSYPDPPQPTRALDVALTFSRRF
jgi:hypothetical protein